MHNFSTTERAGVENLFHPAYSRLMSMQQTAEKKSPESGFQRGPSPLTAHIGLALAEFRQMHNNGNMDDARLAAMLDGIRKYYDHPYKRPAPVYQEIWRLGELRLLRHSTPRKGRKTILLVPSLVNRSGILDLMPRASFMRFLESKGYDAILLDWGDPVKDAGMSSVDALISERLLPALRHIRSYAEGAPDLLGYCMGGLLLLGACCMTKEMTGKIVLLGTPWDFHAGDRHMLDQVALGTPAAFQGMADMGYLPKSWLQSVFAALNAGRAAQKFADFAQLDPASLKARHFVAVEDWLNDGVDLPAALARCCITEWYGENRAAKKEWKISGTAIDPGRLTNHILVVAAQKDRLVPAESSFALVSKLQHPTLLTPDTGHIGMMAGRAARSDVWTPIADWLVRE